MQCTPSPPGGHCCPARREPFGSCAAKEGADERSDAAWVGRHRCRARVTLRVSRLRTIYVHGLRLWMTRERLDGAERWFIMERDEATRGGLRNKFITRFPGGRSAMTFSVAQRTVVPLPWQRGARERLLDGWVPSASAFSERQATQWDRLREWKEWPAVRGFLREFVRETISAPHLPLAGSGRSAPFQQPNPMPPGSGTAHSTSAASRRSSSATTLRTASSSVGTSRSLRATRNWRWRRCSRRSAPKT